MDAAEAMIPNDYPTIRDKVLAHEIEMEHGRDRMKRLEIAVNETLGEVRQLREQVLGAKWFWGGIVFAGTVVGALIAIAVQYFAK